MKKIFATIIICALFVTALVGCKQESSANLIAKDLDTNLNKLEVAVNKLDSVENKYLANPDIYSSLSATPNTTEGKYFALAFNDNVSTTSTTDIVKQALINKITDKLLQGNSNYNTNDNLTCKKYCDANGNCYYTDCNGNNYCYNSNGSCYSCGSIPSTCSYVGETTLKSDTLDSNNDYVITRLSIENDNTTQVNESSDTTTNIDENTTSDINTPNPRVKVFYFSQDSFAPVRLKYNPRYISQYNEGSINEQIESYLSKVQKLYAMSEDSIEANTTLSNCKQNIIDCVKEIKELNDCIINGNCEPSVEQLQALNNYIIDIKTTTKRIKDCTGELSKEVSKISQANTNAMINSVDVMSSNYMRLINHIDTRVTYHKSAIATLEQIKYLLDNAINNDQISDSEIEQLIEDFTIVYNDNNSETEENNNIIDTEINENNQSEVNDNSDTIIEDTDITDNIFDYSDVVNDNSDIYDDTINDNIVSNENLKTESNNEVNNESNNIITDENTNTDLTENKAADNSTESENNTENIIEEGTTTSTNESETTTTTTDYNSNISEENTDSNNTIIDEITDENLDSETNTESTFNNENSAIDETVVNNDENIVSNETTSVENSDTTTTSTEETTTYQKKN